MGSHQTNITTYLALADSAMDEGARAYCLLIAMELSLKRLLVLRNHDLPSALKKLAEMKAVGHLAPCLNRSLALAVQLGNAIEEICTQNADGTPGKVPRAAYPNIRYIRYAADWPAPVVDELKLKALLDKISAIKHHAKNKFNLEI